MENALTEIQPWDLKFASQIHWPLHYEIKLFLEVIWMCFIFLSTINLSIYSCINPIPHDLLERRCYMTLGQYDPELIFGFTSQQLAMLASKLVSDRILDILTSIYINISTFKGVCPSIHVLQTWSMSAYWDFENRKSTKGSPLWNGKKILSPISLKFCVWNS